ncbi:MAG: class I tRNA ligase family protein [Ferruginibacter sp.]
MTRFQHLQEGKDRYLLVPVMPTPNGGLHLGHLTGPYLKMDILARAQRRNGSHVSIIFGSDGYESYTNLKAWQTGRDVKELCQQFHAQMKKDLDALRIEYDDFINPLDAEHNTAFNAFLTACVKALVNSGVAEIKNEKYLYSPDEDCFLTGCWIQGDCPQCGTGTGSYQCEDCGTQYRPMDLLAPKFKRGDYPLQEVDDKDLYLIINKKDELLKHLAGMNMGQEFMDIAKTYLERQGNNVRLTNPGKWGTSFEIQDSSLPHVLFTYTALYFYSLYCGELYKKKFMAPLNPFHKNSKVITVASFGIDCTIPYLVAGVACALEGNTCKPIDYLLPNHFFELEHSKFSTSRGHAIWGNDIANKTPVAADATRYFLAWKNPENEMCNFDVSQFMDFVNTKLAGKFQPMLTDTWEMINDQPIHFVKDELAETLEQLLINQHTYLTPPTFQLSKSTSVLKEWVNLNSKFAVDPNGAYWWLKGFALLAYPVMPDCSISIWNMLGHSGAPLEKDYFQQTLVATGQKLPVYFTPISFYDIKPALPATLLSKQLETEK